MKYYLDSLNQIRFTEEGQEPQPDWVKLSDAEYQAIMNPPKTVEQIKASIVTTVQAHLDREAQSKGYDSILSATSYAGYPNDFQAEGIAFGTWRANVWKYCYTQLAEIESGERPIIPTVEEFITELPTL